MKRVIIASLLSLLLVKQALSITVTSSIDDSDESPNDGQSKAGGEIVFRCMFDGSLGRQDEPNIYFTGSDGQEQHVSTDQPIAATRWANQTSYQIEKFYNATLNYVRLIIKAARVIDSGKYSCVLKDSNDAGKVVSRSEVNLTVLEDNQSVELIGVIEGKFMAKVNVPKSVSCRAYGGSVPKLNLTVGNTVHPLADLEKSMNGTVNVYTGSQSITFTGDMGEQKIKCTSRVGDFEVKMYEAELDIEAPPTIECDTLEVKADFKTGQEHTVTCNVTSNPAPAPAEITWSTDDSNTKLSNHEDKSMLGLTSTSEPLDNKRGFRLTLTVRVLPQDTVPEFVLLRVTATSGTSTKKIPFTAIVRPIDSATSTKLCLGVCIASILLTIFH